MAGSIRTTWTTAAAAQICISVQNLLHLNIFCRCNGRPDLQTWPSSSVWTDETLFIDIRNEVSFCKTINNYHLFHFSFLLLLFWITLNRRIMQSVRLPLEFLWANIYCSILAFISYDLILRKLSYTTTKTSK